MGDLMGGRFARRLTLAFAILGVGTALVTALLVNAAFESRFTGYLAEQQQVREQQLTALFADAYTRDGSWQPSTLDDLAPSLAMSGADVELRAPAGQRLWSLADAAPPMSAMHREMMGGGELGPPRDLPVVVDGRGVGTLRVRTPQGVVPAVDEDFRTAVNRLLIAGGAIVGLIALAAGLVFARRTVVPIAELTRAAEDLATGRRERRAAVASRDEIGQLAKAFNTMADRVKREDELRRTFAADVAHELRTPLAILRSQIEAVQDGITEPTPQTITSLHEETLRLGRLVADLETLASADAAAFTLECEPVDLSTVVRETVDGFADQFAGDGIALHADLAEVRVQGDAVRLRQIVANLLSNARKFVPSGGATTVSLRQQQDQAELQVADTGVGIPPEELPHVFERFYRGHAARAGGSGIGLAVVAELVGAHGGQVTVASEPGRGTTFTVTLPTGRAARTP